MDTTIINEWGQKLYLAVIWLINLLPKMYENYKVVGTEIAKAINQPDSAEGFALIVFGGFVLLTYAGVKKYFDPARNIFAFLGIILLVLVVVAFIFVPSMIPKTV